MTGRERREALEALQDVEGRPAWTRNLILGGVRGSHAHGTTLDLPEDDPRYTDDVDLWGIAVRHPSWYRSLEAYRIKRSRLSWNSNGSRFDIEIHDVRKFLDLAGKGNPNVLCWLFSEAEDVLLGTDAGHLILDSRELFLSKEVLKRFVGYAKGQQAKIRRSEYAGYMGEKRKALVDVDGYDVKHAGHVVRLLWTASELAQTGTFSTRRPHRETSVLREVKEGRHDYRSALGIIEAGWHDLERERAASPLPDETDAAAIDALLEAVYETVAMGAAA